MRDFCTVEMMRDVEIFNMGNLVTNAQRDSCTVEMTRDVEIFITGYLMTNTHKG